MLFHFCTALASYSQFDPYPVGNVSCMTIVPHFNSYVLELLLAIYSVDISKLIVNSSIMN